MAFNGDAMRNLRRSFWRLPRSKERQLPLMIGHRLMGISLTVHGKYCGRARRISIGPSRSTILPQHRPLATRFGQDSRVSVLSWRSIALWMLGYPEAALADADHALRDAREIGQAATLMYALVYASM